MSETPSTPRASKENPAADMSHTVLPAGSLDATSNSLNGVSRQRVVFARLNKEYFFDPVLPAKPTPSLSQEPSKSILKKRSYYEFLADESLFPPVQSQRASTPEPDTEEGLAAYLLSPLTTLVQSVQGEGVGDTNIHDIIEAYCVLTARIRAKFLPATPMNVPARQDPRLEPELHAAMEPLQEYMEHLVCAITRDISRAREDPLQGAEPGALADVIREQGEEDPSSTLPSPPRSSPLHSDGVATPKRSGMNEQQVKHARDLCTVAQSAMKLLSALFCFVGAIQAGNLFNESELSTVLMTLLTIPLSSPLPTPNSRKTSALSIAILSAFSTLMTPCNSSSISVYVVSPHVQAISTSLRRGIDGELGREGKKGAAADSLRAVTRFALTQPEMFGAHFPQSLVPSMLRLLSGPSGMLQCLAGNALCSIAWSSIQAQARPWELSEPQPSSSIEPDVGTLMRACFSLRPPKTKGGDVQMSPIMHNISKLFQALNVVCTARDSGSAEEMKGLTPAISTAAHASAMWALSVLGAVIALADGCLFKVSVGATWTLGPNVDQAAPANTAAKVIRLLLGNKRVAIRTAASWVWRIFTWTILREFERRDGDSDTVVDVSGEKDQDSEENKYTPYQTERMDLARRSFDFLDKGVGVAVVCALLVGSNGREDRELRVDLAMEAILRMAQRRATTMEALKIVGCLLSSSGSSGKEAEAVAGGPSLGWDVNKLLPSALFDGRLADADSKSLLTLTREERDTNKEDDWFDDIPSLTTEESEEWWETMSEIWVAAVKGHGINDSGGITTPVLETWMLLLKHCSVPPSSLLKSLLANAPHLWLNIAEPANMRVQNNAHKVVHARFLTALWRATVQRFGSTDELQQLALDLYDRSLSVFDLNQAEGSKVQDVCLEFYFSLSEAQPSIVGLVLDHDDLSVDAKREFWTHSAASANDGELLRALCLAPFRESHAFDMTEEDWSKWEELWISYMGDTGDSLDVRMKLQNSFAQELAGGLSPHEASRVVKLILTTLLLPTNASVEATALFSIINQSLVAAYESGDLEILEMAVSNLNRLTVVMPQLPPQAFFNISSGLATWISDRKKLLTDEEYDLIAGPTYDAVLGYIRLLPHSAETLTDHCDILGCITERVTPSLATLKAFQAFWTEVYADTVDFDSIPQELCPLLLVCDSALSSQDDERSAEAEKDEDAADGDDELQDLSDLEASSCYDFPPPTTPPSEVGTTEGSDDEFLDPLGFVAPASESPEEDEPDQSSVFSLTRWSSSQEELTGDEYAEETSAFPVNSFYGFQIFSFQSPTGSIPGLAGNSPPEESGVSHPSLSVVTPAANTRIFNNAPHIERSSSAVKKKRSWNDEVCTPTKRRRQDTSDSDSDDESGSDSTPKRPQRKDMMESATGVIPFRPFSQQNLPVRSYQFSGMPDSRQEALPSGKMPTMRMFPPAAQRASAKQSHTTSSGISQKSYVDSTPVENGNPSSKRRRVNESAPSSAPKRPHEYEGSRNQIPESDDSFGLGGVSPEVVRSPAILVPDSDETFDSPVKARMKRVKGMKPRHTPSSSRDDSSSSVPFYKNRSRSMLSQRLADDETHQALETASKRMSSMSEDELAKMSAWLRDMQMAAQDKLRAISSSH